MSTITLPAHFDGQQIVLDTPHELAPNTRLSVIILPDEEDEERADWLRLSMQTFAAGYDDDEPEYTAADIKKWNPDYRGPRL